MSYNIFSWNVRGAGAKGVPLLLKYLVGRHDISCLALYETRVSAVKIPSILRTVGFDDFYAVEAEGFAGGIWLLWSTQWGSLEVLSHHRQYVHARITPKNSLTSMLVKFVYASPNAALRNILWRELRSIAANISEPWVVLGDFNSYLSPGDKVGGATPNAASMQKFRDCLDDCSLFDLGFKGPPFTWEGRGVKERIDWALSNDRWVQSFPDASILHLPRMKSDHSPLLLSLSAKDADNSQRPFRFLASWLTHEGFPAIVKEAWRPGKEWLPASQAFTQAAMVWNNEVFGEIGRRKRRLMRRLEGIRGTSLETKI
ncbi:uncharacterized protein LOC130725156 [Lotus japonicus]|uniref:uncharacterized protein LOC130725156 n=1 Tax=Lotus japonicus TaxID=34305 RepID=UPI00258FE0A2|nr:uncharacterized protein LOC130725156 [Lotus japonicus]